MTIVVGVNLGDGVGIAADTRITYGSEFRDDGLKIYQYPPFFISGISGDVISAISFLTTFYIRNFMDVSHKEGLARVVDREWMEAALLESYQANALCADHAFTVIFAADDSLLNFSPGRAREATMGTTAIYDSSFDSAASVLAHQEETSGNRLLISASFPEEVFQSAEAGKVLTAGSGIAFESLMHSRTTALAHPNLCLVDRFNAITRDISVLDELASDVTFNGFSVGIVIGLGDLALSAHCYHDWPSDSSPNDYEWVPSDPSIDKFPHTMPYTVGFDPSDIETAWIHRGNDDPTQCSKLRLVSFRDPELLDKYAKQRGHRFSATL